MADEYDFILASLPSKKTQTPAGRELEEHVREAILSKPLPRGAARSTSAWSAPCSSRRS